MSRRVGSRGTAGTLRRLTPRAGRSRPVARCLVRVGTDYLAAVDEHRNPVLHADPLRALDMLADTARTVALELRGRGWDAELVPAPREGTRR